METMRVKLLFKSYVVYVNGKEELRTDSERAASAYYHELIPYFFNQNYKKKIKTATERAIVECEVVRKRYPKGYSDPDKAGKTFYRIYHDDDFFTELDHEPKPLEVINAIAYDVDWKPIQ